MPTRWPQIDRQRQSNLAGLFVIGDLAGASVIKLAMEQGVEVIKHIAALPDARAVGSDSYDVIVIGAGAAGLNAALAAQEHGLRCLVLEKSKIASTIEDFPEGKWIYAEPDQTPPKGKLWPHCPARQMRAALAAVISRAGRRIHSASSLVFLS